MQVQSAGFEPVPLITPARGPAAADRTPLVAIVTPVYNGAKYLEATMRCVQRQTYPNLVHVILDNASTDDTPHIIARHAGGRVPLQVSRNSEVLRQPQNWNAAMRLVPEQAKYVQWLCADDLIRSDAVARLVAKAETDPRITIVGSLDVVEDHVRAPLLPPGVDVVEGREWVLGVCENAIGHFPWQAFFIRWSPDFGRGDYFDVDAPSFDNHATLKRMAAGRVGFVLEPLVYTRHHADTVSAQFSRSRNPVPHFWRWNAARDYAALARDARERARMLRSGHQFLVRWEMYYRLVGAKDAAARVHEKLTADGRPPRAADFAMALATYPVEFLISHVRRRRRNRRWSGVINEEAFVAM